MQYLFKILEKAKTSSFHKILLNLALSRAIPFNRPHGIKVIEIHERGIRTLLPYWRINQNHLRGLHACALATLSEFTAGITLLHVLRSNEYRLIMKDLQMTYHYQGKTAVSAAFELSEPRVQNDIIIPLQTQDAVIIELPIETHDLNSNHICTAKITWQIKKWEKVREKI